MNKVARENEKVILTGDFNLNFLKFCTNTEINEFLNLPTRKNHPFLISFFKILMICSATMET